jgi:hypothetical protein
MMRISSHGLARVGFRLAMVGEWEKFLEKDATDCRVA